MKGEKGLFGDELEPIAGFVQVVPERGIEVPGGLTYALPVPMGEVQVGERVEVPMGRGSKTTPGYVLARSEETQLDVQRVKFVLNRTGVRVPAGLLELARWISEYYCCPLGMVLAGMVPAAVKRATGSVERVLVERSGAEPIGKLPKATRHAWEAIAGLESDVFPVAARELAALSGASNVGPVNRLVDIGVLREVKVRDVRAREGVVFSGETDRPTPTEDQQRVIGDIGGQLGGFSSHVLFGVTGSGKTEVYLRLIEEVLARGRSVIVLVPEISLTPQAVARYSARFGAERVAVMHSGLSASQRHKAWRRVQDGQASIALGARSAVFAPFGHEGANRLGLIVVDEEHDGAYKQEELPRYHARDVAIVRAQQAGCPVVLGSATPSLESWRNTKIGKATLHRLANRVGGGVLPKVEIVDLAKELRDVPDQRQRDAMLGNTLVRALQETFDVGKQSIVLLNRRGFATMFCCSSRACGFKLQCQYCEVLMAWHRSRDLPSGGVVRCHHCGASMRVPKQCPDCGKALRRFGAGAQRVEDVLPEVVKGLEAEMVQRMDSDSMHSAAQYHEALDRFGKGQTRVLVGTQMVSKGLDFPDVGLVGVVSADTALHLPDFRAEERTYQLVSQVSGRAGRSAQTLGRVVVQTFEPGTKVLGFAARHDYEAFAARELASREGSSLPPGGRLARIVVRDGERSVAEGRARELYEALWKVAQEVGGVRVDEPVACVLTRIREQFRFEVLVQSSGSGALQEVLGRVRASGLLKSDRATAVDVDPVSLL